MHNYVLKKLYEVSELKAREIKDEVYGNLER